MLFAQNLQRGSSSDRNEKNQKKTTLVGLLETRIVSNLVFFFPFFFFLGCDNLKTRYYPVPLLSVLCSCAFEYIEVYENDEIFRPGQNDNSMYPRGTYTHCTHTHTLGLILLSNIYIYICRPSKG